MRVLKSEMVYKGVRVVVKRDEVEIGGRCVVREVVNLAGASQAAAALPITQDRKAILVRQFRYPAGEDLIEIPAGVVEEGETPLECMKRELLEETGYIAEDWQELFAFFPSPGVVSERIHVFLAQGLVKKKAHPEEDEKITVLEVPFDEALRMVRYGEIYDAKTMTALLYARHFLNL